MGEKVYAILKVAGPLLLSVAKDLAGPLLEKSPV